MLYCIVLSVIFKLLWGKSTYPKGQEMSLCSARGSPTCPWPQHCGTQGIFHLFAIAQIIPMHFLGPTEISQMPQKLLHFPLLFIWIFPRTVSKELCLSLFSPTYGRYRDASAAPSPGAAAPLPPRPGRERSRICPCRHRPLFWPPGPMPPTGPGTGEGAASPPRCRALRGEREDETSGAPLAASAAPPPGPCPSAARHRPTGAGRGADGLGRAARRNGALGPDPRSPDPRSPPRPHTRPRRRPRPALTAGRCDPPALSGGGGGPGAGGPCRGPAAATARLLRRRSEPLPPAVPPRPVSMCGAAALPSEHVPEPAHTRALRAGRGGGAPGPDPRPCLRWTRGTGGAVGRGEGDETKHPLVSGGSIVVLGDT